MLLNNTTCNSERHLVQVHIKTKAQDENTSPTERRALANKRNQPGERVQATKSTYQNSKTVNAERRRIGSNKQ